MREFTVKVAKKTKMSLEQIHMTLSYNSIIKKFADVGNAAFIKFEHKLESVMNEVLNDVKDFKTFNLGDFLKQLLVPPSLFYERNKRNNHRRIKSLP